MAMEAHELETVIVEDKIPCIDMSAIDNMGETQLLRAILCELIMLRGTLTELGSGLSEIGKGGIGAMFKGLLS